MMASIAYLAGLFDGEGCISIEKRSHRKTSYRLRAIICSTTPGVCRQIQAIWGGFVGDHETRVTWSAKKAVELLTDMLPYLVIKREQAHVAIQFQSLLKKTPRYSEADERIFIASKALLHSLNMNKGRKP